MGGRRIALLRQSDEYGRRAGASMAERLRERNTPLVGEEVFNLTDTDFTSQLLRIRGLQPDVVAIYGFPAPAAILTRQARQLGITAQIIGSNTTSNRTYASTVGPAAEGVLNVVTLDSLPEGDEPRMAAFRERFAARYPDLARQNRPDLADCLGFGGSMAFLEGLRRAGPDLSHQSFIAALETLENFETGVTLPTTFGPERREGNLQARVVQFQADLSRRLLDARITAEA
jgi:branched-chain amino acid transport system substrate-binding protein